MLVSVALSLSTTHWQPAFTAASTSLQSFASAAARLPWLPALKLVSKVLLPSVASFAMASIWLSSRTGLFSST
jgi:hypothetical protein